MRQRTARAPTRNPDVPSPGIRSPEAQRPAGFDEESAIVVEPDVKVVARAFLPRGQPPREDVAFILYLLFPNRLSDNLVQRRAAGTAFLCLFEDAAESVATGFFDWAEMGVFYAPVRDADEADQAARHGDVDQFLQIYDYLIADALARNLDLDLAGVYLVGYAPALPPQALGGRDNVLQLNLSRKSPERIEKTLLALDTEFTLAAWEEAAAGNTEVLTIVRRLFGSFGRLLGGPAEAAEPSQCL